MMNSATVFNTESDSVPKAAHSHGVRRSRRLKREGILAISTVNDKMHAVANAVKDHHDHCDTDSVFYPPRQDQPFVRNSVSRRNTRSRKSTASSTTSTDNGEKTPKGIDSGSHSPTEVFQSSLVSRTRESSRVRRTPSFYERLKRFEIPEESPTAIPTSPKPRNYLNDSSPGISPYRSPEYHRSSGKRDSTRVEHSDTAAGSKRHYATITTSFHSPTRRSFSSSSEKSTTFPSKKPHGSNFNSNNSSRVEGNSSGWNKRHHSPPVESPNPFTQPSNQQHKQQKARDVLKAFGKKFFTSKPKSAATASGRTRVAYSSSNRECAESETAERSQPKLQPSPFQQRKSVFEKKNSTPPEVSYTRNKPKARMTDVAQAPLSTQTTELATPPATPMKKEAEGTSDGENTIEEIEEMLKQYKDPDKRVKIRETIRLLKQSLQEGDSSASSDTANHTERTDSKETALSKNSPSAALSRLSNRSTSLKNPKPFNQSLTSSVGRANSFNFSRPKDFILKRVDSSPLLTKVPESKPDNFKEYADSLNNNVSPNKNPSKPSHNKTASPFPFSVKTPVVTSSGENSTTENSSTATFSPLKRSESAKENRQGDYTPISVVPGNVRRSKSILGRILGQKIDSEKLPYKPTVTDVIEQKPPAGSPKKLEPTKPEVDLRKDTELLPKKTEPTKSKVGLSKDTELLSKRTDSAKPEVDLLEDTDLPKPAVDLSKKAESPKPTPRKRTSVNQVKAPSPLRRTRSLSKPPEYRNSLESTGSEESASIPSDQVYEIAGSDSESNSSESSGHASLTLSEIIQADKNQVESNSTFSQSLTDEANSSTQTADNAEENLSRSQENLEKDNNPKEDKPVVTEQPVQVETPKKRKYIVNAPVTSQPVLETETAELFHIQIIRPIGRSNRDVTQKKNKKESKKKHSKEHKKSSEASDDEHKDMDRYSTRALQNRISVKTQILAKEDGSMVRDVDKTTPSTRRLQDKGNKPLKTGDDLRSRLQKYKSQTNGEIVENSSRRNGKITTQRLTTVEKSERLTKRNGDVLMTSTQEKTVITLETTAPKSSRDRTEKLALRNGSVATSESSRKNRLEDSAGKEPRARYTPRSKVDRKSEKSADKLDEASKVAVREMKDISSKITTKSSRLRSSKQEDVNNNKTKDTIATSNGNVQYTVEGSLSDWSARRRKKREQKFDITPVISGTDNEKSAEDQIIESEPKSGDDQLEEGELEKREIRATMKHQHSTPSLSGIGGYSVRLKMNDVSKFSAHAEEHEEEPEHEEISDFKGTEDDDEGLNLVADSPSERKSSVSSSASVHSASLEDSRPDENNSAQVEMNFEVNAEEVEDSTTVDQPQPTSLDEAQNEIENSLENENPREDTPVDDKEETIETDEQIEKSERDEKSSDEAAEADDKESEKNKSDFESESQQNEIVDQTPPLSPYKAADDGDGLQIEIAIVEEVTQVIEIVVEEYPDAEKEITEDSKQEETAEAPKPESLKEQEKEPTEEEKTEISAESPVETKPIEKVKDEAIAVKEADKDQHDSGKVDKKEPEKMRLSIENLDEISDIKMLERLLDMTSGYEPRKKIRAAIRALKRGEKSATSRNQDAKKPSIAQIRAGLEANKNESKSTNTSRDSAKESKFTSSRQTTKTDKSSDIASKYSLNKTERTTSRMSSSAGKKKIGSIFDREEEDDRTKKTTSSSSSRLADIEKRRDERRREIQRNRSMPATSTKSARKAFVAKLEADAPKTQVKKVGRSPTFVVPNANNAKQLLLKWCQSKTRGYEHVDIMNYSSSWASGMAFCALVHNFFPEAFDYCKLDPKNRAENMDLAFKKAEELADIAPLLEVEDMLIMGNRPDSKCIFTYVQFMYNHLKKFDQPLVPTKKENLDVTSLEYKIKTLGESEDL